ncbi:MAG: CoA pyrophosphatase [Atopobiaceae bacterium]|nr:CoA pyrophosphatase [Atopobiaceae bacterium]
MDFSVEGIIQALEERPQLRPGAAVLVPLVETVEGLAVVLEVRAHTLSVQPGEVCLPGGGIEPGETPRSAAIRETCEELLVSAAQIDILGELGAFDGPGGRTLFAYVAELRDYHGTFSPDEVDRTFTIPLRWLVDHEPETHLVSLEPHYPTDYPWELVPGGKGYPWRARTSEVPFYRGTEPPVWGATARVLMHFAAVLRRTRG